MRERRRLKNGEWRYDVRLRDPHTGEEYCRTFRTKHEAETFEATERADRARGLWLDPRRTQATLGVWAEEWLELNPGKRPSTRARDEIIVRKHIVPRLGGRPLGSIKPTDVQRVVSEWATQYAPRTVQRHYGVLRAILRAAVNDDRLGRDPCRRVKLPEVPENERHIVTAGELAALADAMPSSLAAMPYLGAMLGLRWGEVAGLRVSSLDFLAGTLAVRWNRTRGPKGRMVEGPPKSEAGRRTLSMPPELLELLSRHLARRGLTAADGDAYVFVGAQGGPLDYGHWRRRVWLPATKAKAVGLRGLRFHDLRGANATAMVADGTDMKVAQVRLGHSDPRLTLKIYAQATSEADRETARRLGAWFLPPSASTAQAGQRPS